MAVETTNPTKFSRLVNLHFCLLSSLSQDDEALIWSSTGVNASVEFLENKIMPNKYMHTIRTCRNVQTYFRNRSKTKTGFTFTNGSKRNTQIPTMTRIKMDMERSMSKI